MKTRKFKNLIVFILGALCFYTSQILLRIPILSSLSQNIKFNNFSMFNPLLSTLLIIFSAGLFEEGFRFIFRKILLKDENRNEFGLIKFENIFSSALMFGLGHGLCEVGYIFLQIPAGMPILDLLPAILERILTVTFHVSMSILIFRSFNFNREYITTFIAMIIHFAFNLVTIFANKLGLVGVMLYLFAIDFILVMYIFKKKNNFGGMKYEKN